jgi:hypothetical protein
VSCKLGPSEAASKASRLVKKTTKHFSYKPPSLSVSVPDSSDNILLLHKPPSQHLNTACDTLANKKARKKQQKKKETSSNQQAPLRGAGDQYATQSESRQSLFPGPSGEV